jgi:L-fuconolactonase
MFFCKISGMVTKQTGEIGKKEDFHRYIDAIVNAFGLDRVMFGSDWPLCQVAATYEEVLGIVEDYFSRFSRQEQELFFEWNAINFYDL